MAASALRASSRAASCVVETTPYGAPWMNCSADCDQCSPMATDEEPPGPLDLSSSILSTDPAYAEESVSVETALSFATDLGESLTAVASGTLPGVGTLHRNGYAPVAPVADAATSNSLAFLRQSTNARTRMFRRRH